MTCQEVGPRTPPRMTVLQLPRGVWKEGSFWHFEVSLTHVHENSGWNLLRLQANHVRAGGATACHDLPGYEFVTRPLRGDFWSDVFQGRLRPQPRGASSRREDGPCHVRRG